MNIKTVPLGRGFDWIKEGFGLFLKNPLTWIVNLVIFLAIVTVLSLIPFIGAFAAMLLQPVLIGGMLLGCQALERGEELRVEHLFDCFRGNAKPLIMLGLYSGIAYFLVGAVIFVLVGGAVGLGVLGEVTSRPEAAFSGAMLGFVFSGLIGMALSIPVAMATWFAPALVIFSNLPTLDAMKASFSGCLRNMTPFLLYGIVSFLFAAIALIPFGLGLLVLGPTLIASVYAGYRDIFGE